MYQLVTCEKCSEIPIHFFLKAPNLGLHIHFFLINTCSVRNGKNVEFLTAWKAGFKLGKSLIAFEYPKPIFKPDSTSKFGSRSTDPVLNCSSTTVKRGNEPAACSNSASQPSTPPRTETNSPSRSDDRVCPGLLLDSSRLCDSRN